MRGEGRGLGLEVDAKGIGGCGLGRGLLAAGCSLWAWSCPELNHRFCCVVKFGNSCYFLQVFKKFTRPSLIAY